MTAEYADPAAKLITLNGAMTVHAKAPGAGALVAKTSLHVFYPDASKDDAMHFEGKATSSDWNIDDFVSAKVGLGQCRCRCTLNSQC